MKTIRNLSFALKEIGKTSKTIFVLMAALAVINAVDALVRLFLLKWTIDYALSERYAFRELLLYLLLYFAADACFKLFNVLFKYLYIYKFEYQIMSERKEELYRKIETIDPADYNDPAFYDKMDRAQQEIGVRYFRILVELSSLAISTLTAAAVFTAYGDAVILTATAINVISYVIYYFAAEKYKYNFEKREQEPYSRAHGYPERIFCLREHTEELRLLDGLKERLIANDRRETEKYLGRYRGFLRAFFGQAASMTAASNLLYCLVSIYVSGLLFHKNISVGEFVVAVEIVASMTSQLSELIKTVPGLYHSGLLVGDIREVLEYGSSFPENADGLRADSFESLTVSGVSFRYGEASEFELQEIGFSVAKNEILAIAGPNGSGKSTLLDILMALLKPQDGQLCLNGLPYEDYELRSLRGMFGVVFQNFQVYEVSVAENILMRESRSQEDVRLAKEALKFAGLYEKVMALPRGLDTVLSAEADGGFSGGECQRLAIARAYAKPAPVLIFDEPASSLDVFAAEAFYEGLFRLRAEGRRTIIYTAHRPEQLARADRILRISGGRLTQD
ncbi:MAG: ABC transporter ATP-binding protein/permease [Lachnospiraceae bacterium]|nr:ABC transporter ATP-binding protein/permease [Lachnospiraceae bacterium]